MTGRDLAAKASTYSSELAALTQRLSSVEEASTIERQQQQVNLEKLVKSYEELDSKYIAQGEKLLELSKLASSNSSVSLHLTMRPQKLQSLFFKLACLRPKQSLRNCRCIVFVYCRK